MRIVIDMVEFCAREAPRWHPVFWRGIVPDVDVAELEKAGVVRVFTPGASIEEIVAWVRGNVRARVV